MASGGSDPEDIELTTYRSKFQDIYRREPPVEKSTEKKQSSHLTQPSLSGDQNNHAQRWSREKNYIADKIQKPKKRDQIKLRLSKAGENITELIYIIDDFNLMNKGEKLPRTVQAAQEIIQNALAVDSSCRDAARSKDMKRRFQQLVQTLQREKENMHQCMQFYDRIIKDMNSNKMCKHLLCYFYIQTQKFNEILEKRYKSLASGEIRIMIIGESSAGKSTLLNVLLKGNYLPTDHGSCTRIVCELHNCPYQRAIIYYKERFKRRPKEELELTLYENDACWKRLQRCIATGQDHFCDQPMDVERVEIYWPVLFFQDQGEQDMSEEDVISPVRSPMESDVGHKETTGDVGCDRTEIDRGEKTAEKFQAMEISGKTKVTKPQLTPDIKLVFVDSPGFDDDNADLSEAERIARSSDLFLFVLNNSSSHGVAKDRVLKVMKDLKELILAEETLFDTDCTTFLCNKWDIVPVQKADKLKSDILKRLQTAWPRISFEQLFFCSLNETLTDSSSGQMSQKYSDFLAHVWIIVQDAVHLKLEKHFRWVIQFIERVSTGITNIIAKQDYAQRVNQGLNNHFIRLKEALKESEEECLFLCQTIATQHREHVKKMKQRLKFCIKSKTTQLSQWSAEDIPNKSQDEDWVIYQEKLEREIVQRIQSLIKSDSGVIRICERYTESITAVLEKIRTKFNTLESQMSVLGPCKAIDGKVDNFSGLEIDKTFSRPNVIFRKLFVLLKEVLREIRGSGSDFREERFLSNSKSIDFIKTLTEKVLSTYVSESQLESTASAMLEHLSDGVEKTVKCFVACMRYRDKCISEISYRKLDKKKLKELRDSFFQPKLDECLTFYISKVMKHGIDQSRLEIDKDITSSKIGQGGFAAVFKGKLKVENKKLEIAAKILKTPAVEGDIYIFRECFLLRQLSLKAETPDGKVFPHLVQFYGSSYVEKDEVMELQLIMELCQTDLEKRIKNEYLLCFRDPQKPKIPFPGRTRMDYQPPGKESVFYAIDITQQAACGLEFIHNNGIVHRDVKASNFLMNQRDDEIHIKISDFGVSKDNDMVKTMGNSVGTRPYHAPELYTGQFTTHTFSTDVYSFGLLLWEIWHGEPLFNNVPSDCVHPDNFYKYHDWKGDDPTYSASDLNILMKKCCHRNPEKRPEMKSVLHELSRLAKQSKENQ